MSSRGKGKSKEDYGTAWSEWQWNQDYQCDYRYRQNSLGRYIPLLQVYDSQLIYITGEWEYEYGPVAADNTCPRTHDSEYENPTCYDAQYTSNPQGGYG